MFKKEKFLAAPAVLGLVVTLCPLLARAEVSPTFQMVVSGGAKTCLPGAGGTVRITPAGPVEVMEVTVQGLPPNSNFSLFLLQVPKSPFGLAWFQGTIPTDKNGRGHQHFIGRFSIETFALAPGVAPAPIVFSGPFSDASLNPPFDPIQMYHLGLWFDSPNTALAAGCPATVTPFNGEHNAGIQILNTRNFPDDHGPLRNVN